MGNVFDVSTPAKRFRLIAVIEAITWGLLLISMGVKYGAGIDAATMVPGALHGVAFVVYLIITVLTARSLKWNLKVLALALVASIPPFFTVWFEQWASKNGHLGELSDSTFSESADRDTLKV
ncbi:MULTISPECIES: DUF3817 domain-containing protein [Gordonia]|uniref:DUF3817 domain-containing protein n=2 Tax=Gordonia TaxID=2053 RepID=L7LRJ9_9ACTN|nr:MULTISPECIES: DUF3817 domain-containing protein [Gordonia]AUH69446.1 DUF3817 domain-containing protein [Gordonia sp. YC-JH1]KJR10109.1 membrane protein [Gordonia sihwensis]KXT55862.1 membrane protein [Gordonia sp. QH-12]KXT55909.1 membrane protein [Gordonia sp. QH-12]MBY4570584.1 hypothetical protein [Gordonia sihwensis]